jgi:hypothetical protein
MVCEGSAAVRRNNVTPCYNGGFVLEFTVALLAAVRVFLRSRGGTAEDHRFVF